VTLQKVVIWIMGCVFTVAGCAQLREGEARKALEARGIAFTGEAFLDAVKAGQLDYVRRFLAAGMDVNTGDTHGARPGWTPLHWAAYQGDLAIAKVLIAHGANINAVDNGFGLRPLHASLMGRGGEVGAVLLKAGADFRTPDRRGLTPLHQAAYGGSIVMIEELIRLGADVNARDKSYRTPLLASLEARRSDVAQLLIRRGAVIRNDKTGQASLIEAAQKGFTEIAVVLLSRGVDANAVLHDGGSPALFWAARNGHLQLVELLIKYRANVNARNRDQQSPLHAAASSPDVNVVGLLLAKGADVNAFSPKDGTPLNIASNAGEETVAKLLLSRGADVNVINDRGETPLIAAAANGKERLVTALLIKGAAVNAADLEHRTALFRAVFRGSEAAAKVLLNHGADINSTTTKGWTPLMAAAHSGVDSVVKMLIEKNADLHKKNNEGQTALDIAIANKKFGAALILESARARQ